MLQFSSYRRRRRTMQQTCHISPSAL